MKGNQKEKNKPVRKELKYCDTAAGYGCGSVAREWVLRELPAESGGLAHSKEKTGRIKMPVRAHTQVEEYSVERWDDDEEMEFEAAGGVA